MLVARGAHGLGRKFWGGAIQMLTKRYTLSVKNLTPILEKIVDGTPPAKFTVAHLASLGFGASNDRAVVPLLKDLGFLGADGTPTPRYHAYRDRSRSQAVMAEALREAYSDVFHVRENPTAADRVAIEGIFKSKVGSNELTAQRQANTFLTLLSLADLGAAPPAPSLPESAQRPAPETDSTTEQNPTGRGSQASRGQGISTELHYTIQIHLPATKDIEVFNAIFRSLRENLLA
jgi:Family of unknown function (DUF5343)